MNRKRTMRRSNEMREGRHRDKHKPGKRFLRSKEAPIDERLFPGIPDEITWDLIVPKLSWRALPVLSFVNRAWKEEIRTNRVYEERVRANSLETLIIHNHGEAIALYSTSENCCYELPPIPRGLLHCCKCIALGGKIYILGGMEVSGRKRVLEGGVVAYDPLGFHGFNPSRKVHVLDLGRGLWQWVQCASMLEPRISFLCGVIDDKIYVLLGRTAASKDGILFRSEVYDPQKNVWSPLTPLEPGTVIAKFATAGPVGKELFLYGRRASISALYNTAKDEWRFLKCFWEQSFHPVFVTQGKFYAFSQSGIDVYDVKQQSWVNRHTHSFAALRPDGSAEFQPVSVLAVKDELFLTADSQIGSKVFAQLFHCKGFESEKKEMVWQKACSFRTLSRRRFLEFPIQL